MVSFEQKVKTELSKARAKFPDSNCSMIALTKEVGELAKALLDENWDRVVEEAVQVVVMAQRVAEEGDSSVNNYREKSGADV